MGTQLYQLPVIYQPLRPAESIHQAIDSLINLNNYVNDLLQKVQGKITSEKERLDAISSRVVAAETKVLSLRNTTQATTVISPCSYPVTEEQRKKNASTPVFSHPIPPKHRSNFHLQSDIDAHLPSGFIDDPLDKKLVDYQLQSRETYTEPRRGLGQLPNNIISVTSLLLFNSNECPYKEYSFIDNLRRQDRKNTEDAEPLEEPETSFYDFQQGTDRDEIMYRPVHEDMPDVRAALPSQLAGYGNIAANVGFLSNKEKQSQAIAPTAIPFDVDLPEVPQPVSTPTPTTTPTTTATTTVTPTPQPQQVAQQAAPQQTAQTPNQNAVPTTTPPPQKEPIANTPAPNDGSGEMKRGRAPPAPRGGRGGRGGPAKSLGKPGRGGPAKDIGGKGGRGGPAPKKEKKKAASKAEPEDLMQAIQKGVKLKSGAERKERKKKNKKGEDDDKPAPPVESGNLFADLVGALMRRRDAFTGDEDSQPKSRAGVESEKKTDLNFDQDWADED